MPATAYAQTVPSELVCIVKHESGGHQFTPSGKPLISPTNDVGIGQINIPTWLALSKKMGLDIIHNANDNVTFSIWLYNTKGPKIWATYKKYCAGVGT